uniref:Uncharacterized protein n=1 Tax=Oryza nivara TaxID=4536 RepID=A0A0E0FHM0_ORYNI
MYHVFGTREFIGLLRAEGAGRAYDESIFYRNVGQELLLILQPKQEVFIKKGLEKAALHGYSEKRRNPRITPYIFTAKGKHKRKASQGKNILMIPSQKELLSSVSCNKGSAKKNRANSTLLFAAAILKKRKLSTLQTYLGGIKYIHSNYDTTNGDPDPAAILIPANDNDKV